MNKRRAKRGLYKFVTLIPDPIRIDWERGVLPPIEYLWQVEAVGGRGIQIRNISTDHRIELDGSLLKQYDGPRPSAPRDVHGHFVLRSQIVLSGCNVFRSLAAYSEARATRPQILMPVTYWH
jgi:hypothetical protein